MKKSVIAVALICAFASVANANESSRSIPSAKFDTPSKDHNADSDANRPSFQDYLAHLFQDYFAHHSEMMSPG